MWGGWQAILCRSGRDYYPPWSCHLEQEHHFEIFHPVKLIHVIYHPPTSEQAQQYLVTFAKANNI